MRVYIIEYRRYDHRDGYWKRKLSQEGYRSLEDAKRFIESRPGSPLRCTAMYYQTGHFEEYYIHDVLIRDGA